MARKVEFRKIPIEMLIETLVNLYDAGAEYIDITGEEGEVQDLVFISVRDEYMKNFDSDVPSTVEFVNNKKLSDDDINDLLI